MKGLNRRNLSARQGLALTGIAALQASLTDSSHDFYVLKEDLVSSLPEALKLRLELVNNYGTFALFHARSVDRNDYSRTDSFNHQC